MKKNYLLLSGMLLSMSSFAQTDEKADNSVTVIQCEHFGISRPLRELFTDDADVFEDKDRVESRDRENRPAQHYQYTAADGAEYGNDPSTMQTTMGDRMNRAPITSWAGQTGGGYPPDPTGAAGPNHYVQAVNATPFKVYSKTGTAMGSVKNIGALWSPATSNDGDPIVMYDKYADRWFLSQFGITGNKIYIAISTTNDPTGTYYTYTFSSPDFPDYLKFSIWWDGYYMTANYAEKVFVFERDQMLIGNPSARAFSKTYSVTSTGAGFFVPLPADADGSLPASGTPLPIFYYTDNGWGGSSTDAIKIHKVTTTWGASPSATITLDATVPLTAFDASYDPSWNDIGQPGTTAKLDGIGGVCTYRAPWRKWTGYNSVLLNFGVKISSTQRSLRWVELRQDQATGAWTKYQEGTYAPDSKSRWVGSMAMDDNGSIALCYARSSTTTGDFPSLCYTGRLASDPLGTMSFAETLVKSGTSAQTVTNRFGDYSQTSLDPDGQTFWHTGEYIAGGGPRSWIYSFKLPLASGVDENIENSKITVVQNGEMLNVTGENINVQGELNVDLFDVTGKQIVTTRVVNSGNSFVANLNAGALANGTYLVRVGKVNTSFQKVIKIAIAK